MKPLSIIRLIVIAVVVGVIGNLVTLALVVEGMNPVLISFLIPALLTIFAVLLLWAGWHVRRFKERKTTWMTAIGAMRVAIAARACALVSAGVAGFAIGTSIAASTRLDASTMEMAARDGVVAAAGAVFLCVCGVIVERWCLVDTDDGTEGGNEDTPPGVSRGTSTA